MKNHVKESLLYFTLSILIGFGTWYIVDSIFEYAYWLKLIITLLISFAIGVLWGWFENDIKVYFRKQKLLPPPKEVKNV